MRKFVSALALSSALVLAMPAVAQVVYSDGPTNRAIGAYTINNGWAVTDSFTLTHESRIIGFDFGGWATVGDWITQVAYGFSTAPDYAVTGTAGLTNSGSWISNYYYYDVRTYHADIHPVRLAAGTYWFSLQNAGTAVGRGAAWDVSKGPSKAFQTNACCGQRPVPSHSFTLYGNSVPEPASWAMMVGGFGLVGAAMRARRQTRLLPA